VFRNIEKMGIAEQVKTDLTHVLPKFREIWATKTTLVKSALMGTFIGSIPGTGCDIAAFSAYAEAKRSSKHPEKFGTGILEGIAAPESANNAASCGALVPMLALGVPTGPIPAVLLAALMVQGINPGPLLIKEQPVIFWGLIASMYVGNLILLLLNLPLVGIFVNFLRVPYKILYPTILMLCVVGVYAVNTNIVDLWIMTLMGVLGYVLRKYGFETAPIVLGVVLASIIEMSFRQALAMSDGSYAIFFQRPISVVFLAGAGIMILLALRPLVAKGRDWRETLVKAEKGEEP
jgi:putative tricarboxylic transport membrane protein